MHPEDIDVLISDLISNKFLNEERFAEAYVSGKFRIKKWGRIKIRQHLKQKRISDYSIQKGMAQINEDEYLATLSVLANRKWADTRGGNSWDKAAKVKRYLISKGYEGDLIQEMVSSFLKS